MAEIFFSSSSLFCCNLGLMDPELFIEPEMISLGSCWDLVEICGGFEVLLASLGFTGLFP